jgi:hypothetical protein
MQTSSEWPVCPTCEESARKTAEMGAPPAGPFVDCHGVRIVVTR